MYTDRFGQRVTTASARAVALNDDAVDLLFAMQPGADALADRALALDPDFALAHCTKARALAGRGDAAGARRAAGRACRLAERLPRRERDHAAIVRQVLRGDARRALAAVRAHAAAFPRDAVPLSSALGAYGLLGFGGFADFPQLQVELLRSVAGDWDDDWWFLAAHGWAQVEAGAHAAGIGLLERSLEANPRHAGAVHGRVHGFYESGDAAGGEAFVAGWLPGYDRAGVLHGHLAWHCALFALQRGDVERALDIYRDAVAPAASQALPLFTAIDCAAFAMRAEACGHPLRASDHAALADFAAQSFPEPGVPLLNIHLAMAYALAGRGAELAAHRAALARRLARGRQPGGAVAAVVCAAIDAYGAGRFAEAARGFESALPDAARLGGSCAQRDVLADLAIAARLRAGQSAFAQRLAASRCAARAGHLGDVWLARMARCAEGAE